MQEELRRGRLPAWVHIADTLTLALLILAALVFLTGGWRTVVANTRVSVQSGWRILFWAAAVTVARHAVRRRPNLAVRLGGAGAAAARRSAGPVWRAATLLLGALALGRTLALVPLRELQSLGPCVAEGLGIVRQSWLAIAAATILVLARSFVFVWYDQATFNSDIAIVGLMAKHLSEGRAFPLFFYGQSYMLGVEAWLAAPIFWVAGPSVLALQLPLVVINLLVAWLLIVLLRREVRLGPMTAFASSLVFVLAPPATALGLVEANGGSVEPFLYVLLLWILRNRPALFGLTLGLGFLHREFTIYGLVAIVILRLAMRRPFSGATVRHAAVAGGWAIGLWAVVQLSKPWSSPFGPESGLASGSLAATNIQEMVTRVCWAPDAIVPRFRALWSRHMDVLFGTGPHSLGFLGLRSRLAGQGYPGLGLIMRIVITAAFARIVVHVVRAGGRLERTGFAAYLMLVGACSVDVYWLLSCEAVDWRSLRYNLLALLLAVGFAAAFFALERGRAWRAGALAALALWAGASAFAHNRLLREFLVDTPPNFARQAADALIARGVRHATGDYWVAYRLTFLAGERVVLASEGPVRIVEYQLPQGPVGPYVRERACAGGVPLAGRFHLCPE
jgi:hypothetical protein